MKPKKPWYKKAGCLIPLILVAGLLLFSSCAAILVAAGEGPETIEGAGSTQTTPAQSDTETTEPEASSAPETSAPAETDEAASDDVPREYVSALNSAQRYSDMMHMSRAGLYDQLTSEYGGQFTEEAAQYAIENVEADWNQNALESAKNYQDSMDMSPAAIRDQLVSDYGDQFTQEEADYAVENLPN